MNGKVVSLNVGEPRLVTYRGMSFRTGIRKEPTANPLTLKKLNFIGDGQADLSAHGGIDKAVYCYPIEHYDFWRREIGRAVLPMGQFGENVTTEGVLESELRIGDILRIGTAVVQVSEPRIPCYKLVMHMDAGSDFSVRFLAANRTGFYCRVLEEGTVGRSDAITLLSRDLVIPNRERGHRGDAVRRSGSGRTPAGRSGARHLGEVAIARAANDRLGGSPPDGNRLVAAEFARRGRGRARDEGRGFDLASAARRGAAAKRVAGPISHDSLGRRSQADLQLVGSRIRPALPHHREAAARCARRARSSIRADRGTQSGRYSRRWSGRAAISIPTWTTTRRSSWRAAGIGVTPMMNMIEQVTRDGRRDVFAAFGMRRHEEHPLVNELKELVAQRQRLQVVLAYSQHDGEPVQGLPAPKRGRLTAADLLPHAAAPLAEVFLCGPGDFIRQMHDGLAEAGVNPLCIRYEAFGPSTLLPARGAVAGDPAATFTVSFTRSDMAAVWTPSSGTLLNLAEAAGVSPTFGCRAGSCGLCRTAITAGRVSYVEPIDEPDGGYVLPCCAIPETDCRLDL